MGAGVAWGDGQLPLITGKSDLPQGLVCGRVGVVQGEAATSPVFNHCSHEKRLHLLLTGSLKMLVGTQVKAETRSYQIPHPRPQWAHILCSCLHQVHGSWLTAPEQLRLVHGACQALWGAHLSNRPLGIASIISSPPPIGIFCTTSLASHPAQRGCSEAHRCLFRPSS